MVIKSKGHIFLLQENAILTVSKDSEIKIAFNRPGYGPEMNSPRGYTVAAYVNRERAEEVLDDFWRTVQDGRNWYEFPDV